MPKKAAPTTTRRNDLQALKARFVGWLTSDRPEPRYQYELAKVLGVDAATLSDWRHDPYVIDLLQKVDERRAATWAQCRARLERVVLHGSDGDAIQAIRELGKLWGKYPVEKVTVSVERVAYVQPGALRDLAVEQFPELRAN